jgi:tetratricopeptide (TPR) repeat protein
VSRVEGGATTGLADLRDDARAALDLVGVDADAALAAADDVLAALPLRRRTPEQREAASTAHRAAGLALFQLADLVGAESRLRRAVREAAAARLDVVEAEATMSLAFILLERGRASRALDLLDTVTPRLTGLPATRARAQRALVLHRGLGRTDEALAEYAEVLPALEAAGDDRWLARAYHNRSQVHVYRGEVDRAIDDQTRAVELYEATGQTRLAAEAAADVAWLVGMSGRIPESLRLMDDVAAGLAEFDPVAHLDRADVLMRAGLAHEAAHTAERAAAWLADRGWETLLAEAELLVAQAALRSGELTTAQEQARSAAERFRASDRRPWLALAGYVEHLATLRIGAERPSAATVGSIRELEACGWTAHSLDLRITAATVARRDGDLDLARTLLGEPTEDTAALLEVRSRSRHARALLGTLDGDTAGAHRELGRAWVLGERQRALVGASELRALVSGHSHGVVTLGLELARSRRHMGDLFGWMERGRAATLRFAPASPPDDPALSAALGQLRLAVHAEDQARLAGEVDADASASRAGAEREILRLTRQASGMAATLKPVTLLGLRERLGDKAFLSFADIDGRLVAIRATARGAHVVDVAAMADAAAAVRAIEFRLRRAATGFRGGDATAPLRAAVETLGAILAPAFDGLDDRSLVVSPTGVLWRVPWSMLAALRGRPTAVAPSATVWCRASAEPFPTAPRVLAVAGPRLVAAPREAEAVASCHTGSTLLTGAAATVAAVRELLAQVDVAHLATHGNLHSDNALFSALELADGPLMGFDLESLPAIAHTVLLPACRTGEGRLLAGDEMLGLAWALLGAGASSVVATLTSVPDEATADLMPAVHQRLALGDPPDAALATAQAAVDPDDPLAVAGAAAFVVTGS